MLSSARAFLSGRHPAATAAGSPAIGSAQPRVESVDLVRGLALVIMLLEHSRHFFHAEALLQDPTNLASTTPALFLTTWLTHFSAPVFVLLMGVSAALELQRGASRRELSRFLLVRGLLLVILELTIIRFGMLFNVEYALGTPLQLFWALGISMIVLAALVHLPTAAIAVVSMVVIAGHNVLDRVRPEVWGRPGTPLPGIADQLWTVLHHPGLIAGGLFVVYPLIPWVAVLAAGYALGMLWALDVGIRRRRLQQLGIACLAVFLVLRGFNLYGDPAPWSSHPRGDVFTALSFLNVLKYPPSLLFLAITIGPALLLLSWLERPGRAPRWRSAPARALMILGTVPLFFYTLQWYVPHLLSWAAHLAAGLRTGHMTLGFAADRSLLWGTGFSLPVVYGAWLLSLALIYPACHWYAGLKRRRQWTWLRYF